MVSDLPAEAEMTTEATSTWHVHTDILPKALILKVLKGKSSGHLKSDSQGPIQMSTGEKNGVCTRCLLRACFPIHEDTGPGTDTRPLG